MSESITMIKFREPSQKGGSFYALTLFNYQYFVTYLYSRIFDNKLKGMIGYPVSDASIYAAETNRSIVFGSDTANITERQRDLALADLITIICQSPSTTGVEDAMGDWKHKSSGVAVSNISVLMKRANAIYSKYNENSDGLFIKDKTHLW